MSSVDVRPAARADVPALSETLGRAFFDDPVMAWMLPDAGLRRRKLHRLFAALARHHHLSRGGVEVAPHWYLAVIGSDPAVRGKGFGQALMTSRLDRCDAEHAPAYLESSNPDNVAYYQRFGFEVTGELALPEGGPSLIPMWRAAR